MASPPKVRWSSASRAGTSPSPPPIAVASPVAVRPGVLEPALADLAVGTAEDPALRPVALAGRAVVAEVAVVREREPAGGVVERLRVGRLERAQARRAAQVDEDARGLDRPEPDAWRRRRGTRSSRGRSRGRRRAAARSRPSRTRRSRSARAARRTATGRRAGRAPRPGRRTAHTSERIIGASLAGSTVDSRRLRPRWCRRDAEHHARRPRAAEERDGRHARGAPTAWSRASRTCSRGSATDRGSATTSTRASPTSPSATRRSCRCRASSTRSSATRCRRTRTGSRTR